MHPITIRKARPADLQKLLVFEQGIITAERSYDPTLKEDPIHYYDLEQMIAAPHIEVLVAEINTEIIASGYARLEAAKPYLNHETYGYLGFMFTDPNYRGRGVNASIIKALKYWCNAHEVFELRLDVYSDNDSAIKAYEKAGFKKHLLNMRMIL